MASSEIKDATKKNGDNGIGDDEEEESDDQINEEYHHISVFKKMPELLVYNNLLSDANTYFMNHKRFGELETLPVDLATPYKMKMISKEEIVEALIMLSISPEEVGIYWLAHLLYLLPLPPYWEITRIKQNTYGFDYKRLLQMERSPSLYYVDNLVKYHRMYHCKDIYKETPSTFIFDDLIKEETMTYTTNDV